MPIQRLGSVIALFMVGALASTAAAQPVGTFRWQQQPYCNVLTINVVQTGAVYQLDGFDDQCGAVNRASVVGLAFLNPNGTIGIGLTVVTAPGATPLHLDATLNWPSVNGTWRDSAGATGPFVFTPGAPVAGSPRPVPIPSFPAGLTVGGGAITNVAAPVAGTDAANKAYVDVATTTARTAMLNQRTWGALVSSTGTKGSIGRYTTSTTGAGLYGVVFNAAGLGVVNRGQPIWTVTPLCAGFTAAITLRSIFIAVDNTLNSFGASIETRSGAGVATNCAVSVTATQPHPDAPGSPVPPLDSAGGSEMTCTSDGMTDVCVPGKPD